MDPRDTSAAGSTTQISLGERVYRALKEDILSARLGPNEQILEPQLARRFGVSRSPVREALGRLQAEGLVMVLPRKGYLVRAVSLSDVVEVFGLRRILEPAFASEAALRRTPAQIDHLRQLLRAEQETEPSLEEIRYSLGVHEAIAEITGNGRGVAILRTLLDETSRIPWLSSPLTKSSLEEHTAIVEAIAAGDGAAASDLVRRHIDSDLARTMAALGAS